MSEVDYLGSWRVGYIVFPCCGDRAFTGMGVDVRCEEN